MIAEEHVSQPSRAQTLPVDKAGSAHEAASNGTPAAAKQGACAAKTMSPTYLQRRSARGVCPADALQTPCRMPGGEAPDSRQTAQQPDATCIISLSADGQEEEIAEPAGKKQVRAGGQKRVAQEASARAQLRQVGASLKAMKAKGEHARGSAWVTDLKLPLLIHSARAMLSDVFALKILAFMAVLPADAWHRRRMSTSSWATEETGGTGCTVSKGSKENARRTIPRAQAKLS